MEPKKLLEYAEIELSEGNKKRAKEYLDQIINEHPESVEAERAKALKSGSLREGLSYGAASFSSNYQEVVIKDIQMSFISMVVFMVKWAIASIPALVILFIIFAVVSGLFGGLFL